MPPVRRRERHNLLRRGLLCGWLGAQLAAQVPSPVLSGRVVDEQGAPLAGVAVCLLDENPGTPLFVTADLLQAPLARTGADGAYAAALPAAVHGVGMRLLFVAPGRVHVAAPLHSHDGWPVALPRAHTLAGRVVDTDGRPLAGVRVAARDWLCDARYRADNQRVPWLPEPLTAVLTDDGGRFVVPGTVGAGVRLVVGDARACVEVSPVALGDPLVIALPAGKPAPRRPRPPAPVAVLVRAEDEHGRAVTAFRCAAVRTAGGTPVRDWQHFADDAVDAANGEAHPVTRHLVGNVIAVLAVAEGKAATRELLRDETEVTVRFDPESVLQGVVVDDVGKPVAGAELWVCEGLNDDTLKRTWGRWERDDSLADCDPRWGHEKTDADGAFAVHHVAAGAQHLVCSAAGFTPPEPMRLEVKGGTTTTGLRIALARLCGITGNTHLAGNVVPLGASIRFQPAAKLRGQFVLVRGQRDWTNSAPIAADGTFRIAPLPPGDFIARLMLPRPLQQGAPDEVDLGPVTIARDTPPLDLDARPFLPARVRGTVRGPVPYGRLLVGASVPPPATNVHYGYASFECPLATLEADGSFALQAIPGDCTVFVLDLWTGMLLRREPPRTIAAGDDVRLDLDVAAGAVDVAITGTVPEHASWLELLVPEVWWPNGIDAMVSDHSSGLEYSKHIGCLLRPGTASLRLWLPPVAAKLWLVAGDQGDLSIAAKKPRSEAEIEVVPGKTGTATLAFPR